MTKSRLSLPVGILLVLLSKAAIWADTRSFDQSQWATGDMNQQFPSDSNGVIGNSHVDDFYYYERMPMCMTVIDDSLAPGSAARTYDSALLMLMVASDGLSGNDSMRIFGRRITRNWSESGTSWNYYHASADSAWSSPGGDINSLPCTDTIIIDTAVSTYDTLVFHLDTGFVRHMIETDNFGWLVMAENIVDRATFQFYTEDTPDEDYWPILTVYFTEGAQASMQLGRRRRLTTPEREE